MAPKRPSPSDQPPSSVSTSEDEVEGTEEEEEEEKTPKPIQSSHNNPNPNNKPDQEDEENDESGSDSGSDSDNEPVKHMIAPHNIDVKPISSKPIVDTPKSKKPISSKPMVDTPKSTKKPASTSTSSAAVKRLLETDNNDKDSKKKKKKKIADIEEKKSGEEKKLFQRIFSEKDEIDVLNGLLEFKKKGYQITNSALTEFYDFLKGSVNVGASLSQIIDKVRRLNKKYLKNLKRAKPGGGDPTISNPHEVKSYLLSKKIWGDQILKDAEENKSGATALKKSKLKSNGVLAISPKVDLMEEDNIIGSQYQYLDQSLKPQNRLSLPMPPADFGEITAKDGWDKLGSSKAQAFDQRWKALIIKEAEVYLERVELVQEQTKWMLDMHNSYDS